MTYVIWLAGLLQMYINSSYYIFCDAKVIEKKKKKKKLDSHEFNQIYGM